ncbi:MAG: DUF2490 domain-containing protein [Mangrovibacterium sp.]
MKLYRYTLGVCLLFASLTANAQDWSSSMSIGVEKKVAGIKLSLEEDFRTRDNFSTVDRFSTDFTAMYKPWKFLKVGAAYNLINQNHETKGWEVRHRHYFYATGEYEWQRFTLSLREKYQSTYRVGVEETATRINPKQFLRSRLELDYNIKKCKWNPYASMEFYKPLNDPNDSRIRKIKYRVGAEYKLSKHDALDFAFTYSNFRDDDDISEKNMIGVGYVRKF